MDELVDAAKVDPIVVWLLIHYLESDAHEKPTIVTQLILTEPVMTIFRAIFPFNKLLNE